jgi:ATP-binding cassette subfamily B protein
MDVVFQHDKMDCGPACLAMVANSYGKKFTIKSLRERSFLSKEGVSMLGITDAAKEIGLKPHPVMIALSTLIDLQDSLPAILHWDQQHFVVLYGIKEGLFSHKKTFQIADPAFGKISLSENKMKNHWISNGDKGVVLFLQTTESFFDYKEPEAPELNFIYLFLYLKPYKKQVFWLFILLLLGSGATLILPFLTQSLIDKGINGKSFELITVILFAQLSLNLGTILIEIARNWITLFIGTHVSITIISDYFKKVLKLPLKFFDTKMIGDFNQRIQDNERIESFLTSQGLLTLFSLITFLVFFGVLFYYDNKIFCVFTAMTLISLIWSYGWLKKRKQLDYHRFRQRAESQESVYEILNGISEMKLNLFEKHKLNEWEQIQKKMYKVNIRILKINQFQLSGYEFLNQVKNIIVTFLSATMVINGSMTLGQLLSVSYIIGQINTPIFQLVNFFRNFQDAKLSLERLNEINSYPAEDPVDETNMIKGNSSIIKADIKIQNVNFQYQGPKSPIVLKNVNFTIPFGKVTAIVGASGSGKTTLMKLMLKFYEPTTGKITIGDHELKYIQHNWLRRNSGVVMQDGFIFSDTIRNNIICGGEDLDDIKLKEALKIANLADYVESLPLGLNTKIGASGNGISGGQKQRILIARAVYRNPQFLFLDEATSALDAENEKVIYNNLQKFFQGKTVLVIAHRLSTVKNANQIIVLKDGEVKELGTHIELVSNKANYFNLIKNQLELGN